MDRRTPMENIIQGTTTLTIFGGLSGAAYALAKQRPPLIVGSSTALNGSIVGLAFFGSREYLFEPVVRDWNHEHDRSSGVLESTFSGGFTGACLNAARHGRSGVVSGTVVWAALGGMVQVVYNALSTVARSRAKAATPVPTASGAGDGGVSKGVMTLMTYIAPVKKMTDDEYVEAMTKKQAAIQKRLNQLKDDMSNTPPDA